MTEFAFGVLPVVLIVAGWILLQAVILPRLGVGT